MRRNSGITHRKTPLICSKYSFISPELVIYSVSVGIYYDLRTLSEIDLFPEKINSCKVNKNMIKSDE